ncbi:hypothetical protein NDU88_005952 [Pleurodeles waltl]|uniref:Uncharacterized protein n=1 Tax=Pleurodeles waltl TaxID=8319 RepID=A0AAV7NY04_PLEWA|nr:hypothetical protein NDU88_005952 [Pleurodeles waltl]
MEDRTTAVEADVEARKEQLESHRGQLTDITWKLEDQENQQRRNNLRFLGIEEGVEDNNVRAYMIKTLRGAFPELTNWDWEIEIQRTHRFPRVRREGGLKVESKYPRAILFFFGNHLLRQAIFEKARPMPYAVWIMSLFFTQPDYCHVTVEGRWRLRQLIKPFQDRGGEAYLLAPAWLKTVVNGKVKMFTSEVQAKEYLMELKAP